MAEDTAHLETKYGSPVSAAEAESWLEADKTFPGLGGFSHEMFSETVFGAIRETGKKAIALDRWALDRWIQIRSDDQNTYLALVVQPCKEIGIDRGLLEEAIAHRIRSRNGHLPTPQSAEALLRKQFAPLRCFAQDLLAEGLTILAGKPKKGKSYLALDMSLSIAVGREVFMKFASERARVLYISLEDGERRLQRRLLAIQPNLTTPKGLDFLYTFPRLGEGALEALQEYAMSYQVIIIDVLGRILPAQTPARKSLSEYQEFTDSLGPIQQLAQDKRIAIVLIDHVRKANSEDAGDTIMGSQGKFGVADHALIYSRKGEDKDGVLEILSRDLDEEKYVLTMVNGHLEFMGKGESFEVDSEQNRIIKILEEERRPLSIPEIMKAMGLGEQHYKRFRVVMHRLYDADRIGRTSKRGLYTLYGHDVDEDGNRVPF